ncbi:RnfABCDGE type electron transport complex subunit D [Salipiger sp. PrR002]|uniref:RnfABCDGE type electron transport complex subunit D n=1 Tax=Salipiger sp. PrR002 TaxID=2706489 RepID=UPI0013BC1B07|nr:RnfABCDGE type electron transport complex subunit D [Salipiger sp. PrR002]NDV99416.1 RnfABCDGE type electron transport complex subunit D [Salipiger sp. PrR002]NDW55902.1 RnfABCDGE type electron transport complex subunit D [Salipiger sp. PrR004]
MSLPRIIAGPHTHSMFNVPRTMVAVMVCLTPATLFGMAQFGWPAALLFAVTLLSAPLFEALALSLAGKPLLRGLSDGSAVLTGWLLALSLPPWAPWWLGVTGAGIAILLAKHAFGGLGQNLFNPAMVARAMLLIALPVQMTTWVAPLGGAGPDLAQAVAITFGGGTGFDAMSSASTLNHVQSSLDAGVPMAEILTGLPDLKTHAQGMISGSLGETSAYLLLGGGIALVLLRIITLVIPLTVLGSVFILAAIGHALDPEHFIPPLLHLTSGGLMLCAFFIATDYVTSPVTGAGKAIYGIGVGALIFVIRTWGAFPEGVAFAVLLMNAVTPLIDTYVRPRVFGRTRSGKPLPLTDKLGEKA